MSNQNKQNILKGELLDFGNAPYQDNPQNTPSYFVQLRHDDGIIDKKWGVDLERAIQDSGVQKGDTVILNDLGKQSVSIPDPNDPSKSKTVNKGLWELEKYEPVLDLPNVIEHDTEREQEKAGVLDKTKENEQDDPSTPNQAKKVPDLSEFDFELPDNIKNNYFGIVKNRYLLDQKTNYYDKNDKDQVNIAFEDRSSSLHTSRQDEKTIHAMLDMAQSKNWTAIKLKGTEEFKQKAWLEASLRGIEVKGYEPNEKDLAELKARQAERTTNEVGMTAQKLLEPTQQAVEVEESKSPIPEMMREDLDKQELSQHRHNGALLDIIVQNAQEYNRQNQRNVENLQKNNNQNVSDFVPQKSATEIKNDIRQIVQNGYRDGSIKSRDELVEVLKERGFEVKENDKSIRVSLPNSDQAVNLKGEVFTKGYDAIKSLKERLEPDILQKTYPNLKDSDLVHITAYKNKLVDDYKDGKPKALQASLVQLEDSIKQMANGKEMNFPALPVNEIKPDIEVRTTDNHDKSRQV